MYPFSDKKEETAGQTTETALIGLIRQWLGASCPEAPTGIGDDCAVIDNPEKHNLITVDALYYGRHFDDKLSPQAAGAKLLKRNISDIAAMGGEPRTAVLSMTVAANTRLDWLEGFFKGIAEVAIQWEMSLVGGDLSEHSGVLGGHLTLLGYAQRPVLRIGARKGDLFAVTGSLGGALRRKHWAFTPRVAEGQWLAQREETRAMIDLSDGLAKDLPTLLPAGCIAMIDTAAVPLSDDSHALAHENPDGPAADERAWCDGEDYELLCILSAATDRGQFLRDWNARFDTPMAIIGRIERRDDLPGKGGLTATGDSPSLVFDSTTGRALPFLRGYEHFRGA